MYSRCPDAVPKHLAWIGGWAFIINARGFANVVPDEIFNTDTGRYNPGVYGVLYEISEEDEDLLDGYEGVEGGAYEKVEMLVWVQQCEGEGETGEGESLERVALVYIDRRRTEKATPRLEYVRRMNRGIREASSSGLFQPLPGWYVEEVMRPFIPEEEG
ncbi:hypothetical protein CONLIGDRAFT_628335 [Coniochaeta ligniaria NRRL 30616]|uniref:gamma-glutamylcyclotransferase n=1 Tax=Coniochaeta ligniaria NRRL 30616 TaxID=1408157 RepID=A0A1J7J0Z2_9PEZI|nr:hypothetical protein CONLIGDRAFT_628335 [Coniochaeta ligniaria NRRL 30616]